MTKIDSLYEFIKEKSQEKNRPLKVICDWDDCIQPFWPWIAFQGSPDKDNLDKFPEYFEAYFNEDVATNKTAVEFVQKAKKEKLLGDHYSKYLESYSNKDRYYRTPLTTVAQELLLAIKNELIGELLIISSFSYEYIASSSKNYRTLEIINGKMEKFFKTFGQIPNICNFEHTELKKNTQGEWVPNRWERVKETCPEFDMFIDDSKSNVSKMIEKFPSDKIYVLNDYRSNDGIQGSNIYKVKTGISNFTEEDFVFDRKQLNKDKENELVSQLQQDENIQQEAQIEVSKQFEFLKK